MFESARHFVLYGGYWVDVTGVCLPRDKNEYIVGVNEGGKNGKKS